MFLSAGNSADNNNLYSESKSICNYILVNLPPIKISLKQGLASSSIDECNYSSKNAKYYYLSIASKINQCNCLNSNINKKLKSYFLRDKVFSLNTCIKNADSGLKLMDKVINKIIYCN